MTKDRRKHDFTYDAYKALVAQVESLKATTELTVDKACEVLGIKRKFYNYARQMLRRGKPMSELGLG